MPNYLVYNVTDATPIYQIGISFVPGIGESILDSSSNLVGNKLTAVEAYIGRSTTSTTGSVTATIYRGTDDAAMYQWSFDISSLPTGEIVEIVFGPTSDNTYALASGDKILIEYYGGNSSNFIVVSSNSSLPFDGGAHTTGVFFKPSTGYSLISPKTDLAAQIYSSVAPPSPPPPTPSPPPPAFVYNTNTAKDLAGFMWTIPSPLPPPPPPVGTPPGPPPVPPQITEFYSVPIPITPTPRCLNFFGLFGVEQAFLRVGEVANSSKSQMIGKVVKEVDFIMARKGSPTGTLTATIRKGSDDTIAATMGTQNVAKMNTTYTTYKFVNQSNTYALQKNDKIQVEYSGGDGNNYVLVHENYNDPYDGKNTCSVYYTRSKVYQIRNSYDVCGNFWH